MSNAAKRFPHFDWTFSTLGCPELNLQEACDLAESYGSLSLEARTLEGTAELPALFKERFGTPDKLAGFMDQQPVTIDFLDSSLKLIGNDEAARAEFLEFIPWAEALGVRWLRVFDGGKVVESLTTEEIDQALDTLDWWSKTKESSGWKADMAIETHDSLVYGNARSQLLDRAKAPIRFIWDSHHTWKKSEDSLEDSWKQLKSLAVNVHVKDSVSKPSARHPFSYVQLGEGEFPLDDTLEMIDRDGYTGNVSVEWERQWHPYLPPLETALAKARALNWF